MKLTKILGWKLSNMNTIGLKNKSDIYYLKINHRNLYNKIIIEIDTDYIGDMFKQTKSELCQNFLEYIISLTLMNKAKTQISNKVETLIK